MFLTHKSFATLAVISSMAIVPAAPVAADKRDVAAGLAIGVIGAAIVHDVRKKNKAREQAVIQQQQPRVYSNTNRTRKATRSYTPKSTLPRIDPDIQRALNVFDYNAGTADGVVGSRTRAAVRAYQRDLGDTQTGTLTVGQKSQLLDAYSQYKKTLLLGG